MTYDDQLRANAIISRLVLDGKTFNATEAKELREMLDVVFTPLLSIRVHREKIFPGGVFEGLSNIGKNAKFCYDDKETVETIIGEPKKIFVGIWSVWRDKNAVNIEKRFSETMPHDFPRLRVVFRGDNPICIRREKFVGIKFGTKSKYLEMGFSVFPIWKRPN